MPRLRVGCAGWSVPRASAPQFPGAGTHLQRYAARLNAAEINSSFYRPHRRETYERWARSVPATFAFSVKLPRSITHEGCLADVGQIGPFFDQVEGLGEKLGVVLVQLPPSLALEPRRARRFFAAVRERYAGGLVCEPRHASWFTEDAERLLGEARVGRAAADPARAPAGDEPGGWRQLAYYRLHGTPRVYWSSYDDARLDSLTAALERTARASETWCIFDNTGAGAAVENALYVLGRSENTT
jgi:uncharacterized protein YecE (DUF72 family)